MNRKFRFLALLCLVLVTMVSCNKNDENAPSSNEQGQEGTGNGSCNGMDYVDLGLSVKWATCNIGATKPEEYGNYYAWGEVETKSTYGGSTYKYFDYDSTSDSMMLPFLVNKYCIDSSLGKVDNKTTLEKSDDVAYTTLGGNWRIPTNEEWTELKENCTWMWMGVKGVMGFKISSTNGNFIFLPAGGDGLYGSDEQGSYLNEYGGYWSSELATSNSYRACRTTISSSGFSSSFMSMRGIERYLGQSVRPVLAE